MNEEAVWISLDLPQEQRRQIDEIILEAYKDVTVIQKNMVITDLSSFTNLYKIGDYMNKMSNVRTNVNDNIIQILSPQQRDIFESKLEERQGNAGNITAKLLALNLTATQQTVIVKLLLQSHKQDWKTISDKSLSWEQRITKLQRRNLLRQISTLLTADQLSMAAWMH